MRYHAPTTFEEAARIAGASVGVLRFLAGGTDVLVQLRAGTVQPDDLIDLKHVPGVQEIGRQPDGAAMTSHLTWSSEMKKAAARSVSVAARPKPQSTESLPYGLRELAPLSSPRVFCGILAVTGERVRLQAAEQTYVLDVHSPFVLDRRLNDQWVSVLGYASERTSAAEVHGESIVAMNIVSLRSKSTST